MPDQNVMKIHLSNPGDVSPGDIVQCPRCCEKFVVLPNMIQSIYWDPFDGPGDEYFDPYDQVVCPTCNTATKVEYHVAQFSAGIEIPLREPKKEKPNGKNGKKRSRKSISK